jgi:hypothetical protein
MKFLFNFFKNCFKKTKKQKYAYVSADNGVIGREDFPLKIERRIGQKGDVDFTVLGKFENSSEVSIIPDEPVNFSSALSDKGITITFSCLAEEIPNFRIEIK